MNLLEMLAGVEPAKITAMQTRINTAIAKRVRFELEQKPRGSHVELRRVAAKFNDSPSAAKFFHVLNVNPDTIFNKVRKDGWRTNLKGLMKLRGLIDYVTGRKDTLDRVSFSLLASTIIAARMGQKWLYSNEQEFVLSEEAVKSLPSEVQEAIKDYQHKHMTIEGDSRPQACQFRTTFSNLGVYHYRKEEFEESEYQLAIQVDLGSPLVQYLVERWELDRFTKEGVK